MPKKIINETLLENRKITKTTDFIMPLFGKSKSEMLRYVINSYLNDPDTKLEWKCNIFILVRFSGKLPFKQFSTWLEKHPQYRGQYDLFNAEFTMYILEIPKFYKADYEKFLKGKYSKMSEEAKVTIMKGRPTKSTMYNILYKGGELKERIEKELHANIPDNVELWSIWNEKEEFFNRKEFEEEFFYEEPMKMILNHLEDTDNNPLF
jgi:hypothetical protein